MNSLLILICFFSVFRTLSITTFRSIFEGKVDVLEDTIDTRSMDF